MAGPGGSTAEEGNPLGRCAASRISVTKRIAAGSISIENMLGIT